MTASPTTPMVKMGAQAFVMIASGRLSSKERRYHHQS